MIAMGVALLAFIAVVTYLIARWRQRAHYLKLAHSIASMYRGQVSVRTSFGVPQSLPIVRFRLLNWDCQLELLSLRNVETSTCIAKFTAFWPEPDFRIVVTPSSMLARIQNLFLGIKDIVIGNWRFDLNYILQSNRPEEAKERFTADIVMRIAQMNKGPGTLSGPYPKLTQITTSGHTFMAIVESNANSNDISKIIENAVGVLEELVGNAPQIQFIGETGAGISLGIVINHGEGADCLVCGEQIKGHAMLTCTTCSTPHHKDCWEYIGGCSIYACGGKKAR